MSGNIKELQFPVTERTGAVSALLMRPADARALLVLAHGAGAGMRHRFMEEVAVKLADRNVATFRYQFPYMEKHIKRPDSQSVLTDSVRAAVRAAMKNTGALPVFAGGKSMGGRMTSLAASQAPLNGVRGLIFFGFPLHAAGSPGAERGQHLLGIKLPMLFLQGSRDALAQLKLLKPLTAKLGKRAELFVVEGGDHSFHLLKSAGRTDGDALDSVVTKTVAWIRKHG